MAYQDALFQLGMDLTRSSTAQKEDHGETAHVAHSLGPVSGPHEGSKSTPMKRESARWAGRHLIIDLFGAGKLDDIEHIERTLKRCVEVAGATLLRVHLHHLAPGTGVTGVAVLAESHISIHTWPEQGYAALDVFMCGDAKPHLCVDVLKEAFDAENVVVKSHQRGLERDVPAIADLRTAKAKKASVQQLRPRARSRKAA
jgi:S-adenosylmethionine decarboxylase